MKPEKAAIYCRISLDRKGLALGVKRQEEDVRTLLDGLGWAVAEVYIENDTSASKGKVRPVFERMKKDVEEGSRDGIAVYNIDRLTRRLSELAGFLDWRKEVGIPFVTTEGDSTETANGVFMLQVKGAMAQQEAERISERVTRAFEQRRERGLARAGGPRPFGWSDNTGSPKLVPVEAQAIRDGAAVLLSGGTFGAVAREWTSRGIAPVSAPSWTRDSVRSVYRSPRIAGLVSHEGQITGEGTFPAILDRPTWEAVVEAMQHGAPKPAGWGARVHVLSGFVFCALCGSTCVAQGSEENPRASFRCDRARAGCGGVKRNKRWLDALVDGWVRGKLADSGSIEVGEGDSDASESVVSELETRIVELRARHERLEVDDEDFYPILSGLRRQLNEVRKVQAEEVRSATQKAALLDPLQVWEGGSLVARRALLSSMLKGVYVKPVGRIGRAPIPLDSVQIVEA